MTSTFKDRIESSLKRHQKAGLVIEKKSWGKAASAKALGKAEAAIGAPLPPELRAFYGSTNGAELRLTKGAASAGFSILPLEQTFSHDGDWSESAFHTVLWVDDMKPAEKARCKRLRPLLWLGGDVQRSICIDVIDHTLAYVDRTRRTPIPSSLAALFDGLTKHFGLEGFEHSLIGASVGFEERVSVFLTPLPTPGKLGVGSRVAFSVDAAKRSAGGNNVDRTVYGEVKVVDGARVAVHFDHGQTIWVKKSWLTLDDGIIAQLRSPTQWKRLLERAPKDIAKALPFRIQSASRFGPLQVVEGAYVLVGLVAALDEAEAVTRLLDLADKLPPPIALGKERRAGQRAPQPVQSIGSEAALCAAMLRMLREDTQLRKKPKERLPVALSERYRAKLRDLSAPAIWSAVLDDDVQRSLDAAASKGLPYALHVDIGALFYGDLYATPAVRTHADREREPGWLSLC